MALGGVLSAATIILFLTDLQTRYWDRIAVAKTDTQSFAKILAEHTALTFEDVNRVLLEAEAIRNNSLHGICLIPRRREYGPAGQLQKSSSVVVAVGWTDASGEVLAYPLNHAPPRANISEMSHFYRPA